MAPGPALALTEQYYRIVGWTTQDELEVNELEVDITHKVLQLEAKINWVLDICKDPSNRKRYTPRQAIDFFNAIITRLEIEEIIEEWDKSVHDAHCFKNQAYRDLGVGGDLASCTCGGEK